MDLKECIDQKLEQKDILLMTHQVVGYPSLDENFKMLQAMDEAGVDIVELQMPFSEPVADGPLFIKANFGAINNGITTEKYFEFFEKISTTFSFKVLFMGYFNPVYKIGFEAFIDKLKQVGALGHIIGDLPVEEYGRLAEISKANSISPIVFFTPTQSKERMDTVAKFADGLVYCVARKGVTGSKTQLDKDLIDFIAKCKKATNVKLALGFGIAQADDISILKGHADIAIVGTALLKTYMNDGLDAYKTHLKKLVGATL